VTPLVINYAPTGIIPTKELTPHVPLSVPEIIDDVRRCAQIGITIVHLHARDDEGKPTHNAEVYARLIGGIRAFDSKLILCVSLSGRMIQGYEQRRQPLNLKGDLKPDMASLTLSSLNFSRQVAVNSTDTIKDFAQEMLDKGIVPELEIFDLGMINYAKYLIQRDLLRPPFYANLFLGNVAGAQIAHAATLVQDLPDDTVWSLAGVGDAQLSANVMGIAMGGGVRVGLEDAIHMDAARTVLATNVALVERIHRIAGEFERKLMTPLYFRARLDLEGKGFGR
jgi:uncharacterized protein (DUF849 family)